jgi:hypothetical protein
MQFRNGRSDVLTQIGRRPDDFVVMPSVLAGALAVRRRLEEIRAIA